MSLVLRAACQDTLDDFNLSEYHVRVNQSNSLSIVSGCGKPLINIQGIRFDRKVPSSKEIALSSNLLAKFLRTHSSAIDKYFDAQEVEDIAKITVDKMAKAKQYKYEMPYACTNFKTVKQIAKQCHSIQYTTDDYELSWAPSGAYSRLDLMKSLPTPTILRKIAGEIKGLQAFFELLAVYAIAKGATEILKESLNSCEI